MKSHSKRLCFRQLLNSLYYVLQISANLRELVHNFRDFMHFVGLCVQVWGSFSECLSLEGVWGRIGSTRLGFRQSVAPRGRSRWTRWTRLRESASRGASSPPRCPPRRRPGKRTRSLAGARWTWSLKKKLDRILTEMCLN